MNNYKSERISIDSYQGGHGYILVCEGGNRPSIVHLSEEAAINEAHRLARQCHKPIYMFKAVRQFQVKEAPIYSEDI